jgi:hypothetical protein
MNIKFNPIKRKIEIAMLKKLLIVLAALMPTMAPAQVAVGGWTLYSAFSTVEKIVETDTYAYYTSAGSLYRVDKDTYEVSTLNLANKLNDSNISGVYANPDGKSVIVAYTSGNMDRLYDDGRVVNMSEIKDAIMSKARTINDIAFGKDKFYVATAFGLVTYDLKKNEVRETLYTSDSVALVAAMGDIVAVHYGRVLYFARQSEKLTDFSQFHVCSNYSSINAFSSMQGFGDNMLLLTHTASSGSLYKITVDIDKLTLTNQHVAAGSGSGYAQNITQSVRNSKNGGVYVVGTDGVYSFDSTGNLTFINGVAESTGTVVSYYDSADRMWIASSAGMQYVNTSNPSSLSVIESVTSGSGLTTNEIDKIYVGPSGKIYLYNLFEQMVFGITNKSNWHVMTLDNGVFTDVSGTDVEKANTNGPKLTTPFPVAYPYNLCEDPDDPDAYYIGTVFEGMYRIKDGKQTHKYDHLNSDIYYDDYSCRVLQPIIDNFGNLWIYFNGNLGQDTPNIYVLPAAKRTSTDIQPSDWKVMSPGFSYRYRDGIGINASVSGYVVFANGRYSTELAFCNTKGTQSVNDDTCVITDTYIDQDNKELSIIHITALCEDKNGKLWVGTDAGVFEITDMSKVTSSTVTVNHLKVPRNDGTNLADYLLDSQMVTSIAVDASNRKWISTLGSGVYLVSEDGDEILAQYTADNSILPKNDVYAVACDPNSNKVYFGTSAGLVEYNSTSAPGKESYDDVYAYPNPVKPDYTGWITVTGLMENSLVKITDAAANVITQGTSDGGMFVWDGCNRNGERVKSGVYYVFASQNATGSNTACVTKIMVIN